ncbi:cytochrome P450 [Jatrophihabitans sp.]|uniref:cytochrome P450 n=1 Tax=Jatrophihabitans sp. TaxID=1932789 RepID=UPI0030C76B12|nr:hypothetical protein [Jatrophihabitans sp.]
MTATLDPSAASVLAGRLFDLDPEMIKDPYAVYRSMREQEPVLRVRSVVAVSRYEDIRNVLRDPVTFSSRRAGGSRVQERRAALSGRDRERYDYLIDRDKVMIGQVDPPDHTRLRRFVNTAFSAASISAMRAEVELLAQELLNEIDARGSDVFDFSEFTYRLPFIVMCRFLGVPDVAIDTFRGWADDVRSGLGTNYEDIDAAYTATVEIQRFVADLIADHRARRAAEPTDLIGRLVARQDDGAGLTDAELDTMFTVMLTTGNTNDMIANAVIALDEYPAQRQPLLDDPGLIRHAVEEFFRYCPVVHGVHRVATADSDIAGFEVRAGETVRLLVASGNHDPDRFADPDRLDVTRADARQHLDFGYGIHTCLGQWLSRLEIEVALQTLLHRHPGLRVAEPFDYRANYNFHGPQRLLVRTG